MARWQVMRFGKPTGQIMVDNVTAAPMEPGFTDTNTKNLLAINLSLPIIGDINIVLGALGYSTNYIDSATS